MTEINNVFFGQELSTVEVGKPFTDKLVFPLPADVAQYNFRGGQHELVVFFNRPSAQEVGWFRSGLAKFALYVNGDVLVFLFKFGGMGWSSAIYSWLLVPEAQRTIPPELKPNEGILLPVILVDGQDGIVKSLRALMLSQEFSQELHKAILDQVYRRPRPGKKDYDQQVNAVLSMYTEDEMVERAVATCTSSPTKMGRPLKGEERVYRKNVMLTLTQAKWLEAHSEGTSATLRALIDKAMEEENSE